LRAGRAARRHPPRLCQNPRARLDGPDRRDRHHQNLAEGERALLVDIDAFFLDYRLCGDLDAGGVVREDR
jgi:hypothetical protein